MEFLNQRELEQFSTDVEERGVWLRELAWINTINPQLMLLNLIIEIIPSNETAVRESVDRFSYAIASRDSQGTEEDYDLYGINSRIRLQNANVVQDGWKPLINSIVSFSGIKDPILLLPLVDYEMNFLDQSRFIESVGYWLPPELVLVVVSGSNIGVYWDKRKVRNHVYCLTDGQYSAIRQNKVRRYESKPLIQEKPVKKVKYFKIQYIDPMTGFSGEFCSQKSTEEEAINELNIEAGFKVNIREIERV